MVPPGFFVVVVVVDLIVLIGSEERSRLWKLPNMKKNLLFGFYLLRLTLKGSPRGQPKNLLKLLKFDFFVKNVYIVFNCANLVQQADKKKVQSRRLYSQLQIS